MKNTATTNTCADYLAGQAVIIREQRDREVQLAARVGVSVPTLRLLIEASAKRPGLRWAV